MFSRAAQKGIRRDPFTALHRTAALWKRMYALTGFLKRVFNDFSTFLRQSQLRNRGEFAKIPGHILCNMFIHGGGMFSSGDIGLDFIIVSLGQALASGARPHRI